jgi:Family of unknown function (DUF5689)
MAFIKNNLLLSTALLFIALGLFSCVKNEFDEPPVGDCNVNLTANTTIKALKAMRLSVGVPDAITEDIIIKGSVISDDRLGNFYKTLVIQDGSAGIEIKIDNAFLYQSYPVGREIYVRCKGLLLSDYFGVIQLIGSVAQQGNTLETFGLTEAQERLNIVRGCNNVPITPRVVTMTELNSASHVDLISTLIKMEDVQFTQCDAARPWADVLTNSSLNRELENCSGAKVLVRSSGYADFAAALTPTGKGALTAVFSVYSSDRQLYIRDLNDAAGMTGTRCASTAPGTGTETEMKISDLRAVFMGTTTSAPASRKIKGHVISDRVANNLNNRNLYLQEKDGSAGIVVRFTASHCFEMGDEIEVVVSSQELSQFNSLLQVNNVPLANAGLVSRANTPVVRTATIAQINSNFDAWESTLVKMSGVTITGSTSIYSGNKTLTDASGSIAMFTQSGASFANFPIPTAPVSVTAIVSDFNGKQVILRNKNDVQ